MSAFMTTFGEWIWYLWMDQKPNGANLFNRSKTYPMKELLLFRSQETHWRSLATCDLATKSPNLASFNRQFIKTASGFGSFTDLQTFTCMFTLIVVDMISMVERWNIGFAWSDWIEIENEEKQLCCINSKSNGQKLQMFEDRFASTEHDHKFHQ